MKHRVIPIFLLLVMLASLLSFTPARAAGTIYVNTATDDNIANALCSLREAIIAANTDAIYQGCPAGAGQDTILFNGDYNVILDGSQLPAVTTTMTINGNGKDKTIVKASANPNIATYRVFEVGVNGNLTLDGMTIANGRCNGSCATSFTDGGGIFNLGTLTITNSRVSFNKANGNGGGISNSGTLFISTSTIDLNLGTYGGGIYNLDGTLYLINDYVTSNIASVNGGALFNKDGTFLIHDSWLTFNSAQTAGAIYNGETGTITNSTLDNNSAQNTAGGAIYTNYGQLSIANSTFFGNSAATVGGAISSNAGSLDITNSTFVENSATEGGGIRSYFTATTLKNTLMANNLSGNDCHFEGAFAADHYNIDTDGTCQDATQKTSAQVNLGPLSDNEGPTPTTALLHGSHAIDQGDPAVCAAAPINNLDQRGVTRPQNTTCDVGAYEMILTFADVPFTHWAWQYIESIHMAGITGGCGGGNYCPNTAVTREQMAVFLLVARNGTGYTPPSAAGVFADVPADDPFAPWIEQLAAEGITGGCGGGNYCPDAPVTREQMAVFLLVARNGAGYTPPSATGVFADVPADDPFAPWIEQLAAEGITGGCGGGNYCPKTPITRAQMAVFLVTTFNLP